MALLAAVKLSLLTRGFARTRRLLERWSERSPSSLSDRRLVERIEYSIALGAAFFPGRALCLEQSLTLHFLLRRAGVESRLRLGVQPHPFAAHAWVELNGEPVNDVREHVRHFTPLPERAP